VDGDIAWVQAWRGGEKVSKGPWKAGRIWNPPTCVEATTDLISCHVSIAVGWFPVPVMVTPAHCHTITQLGLNIASILRHS